MFGDQVCRQTYIMPQKGNERSLKQQMDVIALITEDQRKLIDKAITEGYPVEICPSKDGFNIYKVNKKIIMRHERDHA